MLLMAIALDWECFLCRGTNIVAELYGHGCNALSQRLSTTKLLYVSAINGFLLSS